MHKLFKIIPLLMAAISAVPATAIDGNEGDVVGTIGGPVLQVKASHDDSVRVAPIDFIPEYMRRNINFFNDWEMIKTAVFAKKGEDFARQFNAQYPEPSDAGVRALADQFDECNKYDVWLKIFPPLLPILIGNEEYRLVEGRMTDIIIEYKKNK